MSGGMEANFLRRLGREILPRLAGCRLDKIYEPVREVFTFVLSRPGESQKLNLIFSSATQSFLFLSSERPDNPKEASARAMWLRKRLDGRRIVAAHLDWPGRRLGLELSSGPGAGLVLDLGHGVELVEELEAAFFAEPAWPDLDEIIAKQDIWKEYPHISPPLRQALAELPSLEAGFLYEELRQGPGGPVYMYDKSTGPWRVLPFRPPESQRAGLTEKVFATAAEAACAFAGPLLARLGQGQRQEEAARNRERKRLEKTLARLDGEQERMNGLIGLMSRAEALKANLYALPGHDKLASVALYAGTDEEMRLDLDPSLSIIDNMQGLYAKAAKGRRGLSMIAGRRREIQRRLDSLDQPGQYVAVSEQKAEAKQPGPGLPSPAGKGATASGPFHVFTSSDGYIILRGKNSRANMELLRRASPHDLWFHVQGGPGAHCLLKRPSSHEDVPGRSKEEAAVLAGLKSWRASSGRAEVICCQAKYVRNMKGAPAGTVRVDKIAETLLVDLDFALEERLTNRGDR